MTGRKNKRGRFYRPQGSPTITSPLIETVCSWIADGNTFEDSCAAVGIVTNTARTWLLAGARELEHLAQGGAPNADQALYARFKEQVERARARAKTQHVRNISRAGKKDWRASGWLLERQYPREYSQQIKLNVGEELDRFLNAIEAGLTPEEFARVIDVANRSRHGEADPAASGTAADQHED